MGGIDGHLAVHLDVDLDEPEVAGLAGAQLVEAVDNRHLRTNQPADFLLLLGGKGLVHQAACRLPGQIPGRFDDENGDADGRDRVQPVEMAPGEEELSAPDDGEAGHDARRGVNVGPEVPAVGDEGDRIRLLPHLEQPSGDEVVGDGGNEHDSDTPADGLHRLGFKELPDGLPDDPSRGNEDQQGLDGPGDVFDLSVAERVPSVRRQAGGFHRKKGNDGGHKIDAGMDRLRHDRYRSDQDPRDQLHDDERRVGNDGKEGDLFLTFLCIHGWTIS